ncbi:hypothetical protein Btru_030988 [Bulinus truncatus]|nr:hypothetical protein Btru_030988 [Bulinus truncatus]
MECVESRHHDDVEIFFKAITDVIRWDDETCAEVKLFNAEQNKHLMLSGILTTLGALSGMLLAGPLGAAAAGFIGFGTVAAATNQTKCSSRDLNFMFIVYTLDQMSKEERKRVVEKVTKLIGQTSVEALKSFASTNIGIFSLLIVLGSEILKKVTLKGQNVEERLNNIFRSVSQVLILIPQEDGLIFLTELANVVGGFTFKQFVLKCIDNEKEIDEACKIYLEKRIWNSRNYLSRCYTLFSYLTKYIGMAYLTEKHINFVNSPMGDKPCTDIPGIGPDHARELMQHGYANASHILSLFLQPDVNKDKSRFRRKLLNICTINASNFQRVYNALQEWTDQHQ